MQEEINHRGVALVTQTARLTGRTLWKLLLAYVRHQKQKTPMVPQGKQSVKKLARQGQGLSSLDMNDEDIKKFDRVMKKYGVDYAVMTDRHTSPPTHTLFFKERDADAITKASRRFALEMMRKGRTPSVLNELHKQKEVAQNQMTDLVKNKVKEQVR